MKKIGIVSKQIVITSLDNNHPRYPLFGMIVIADELIENVILLEPGTSFSSLCLKYKDWELLNYEDYCVSPGIIDLNVRKECENKSQLTKTAIKGGVTVVVIEDCYYQTFESDEIFYCDTTHVLVINDNTNFSLIPSNTSALKCYLFPPCPQIKSVSNLENIFGKAQESNLPLFIDATLPDPRMLYMASPLRLEPVEDRKESEKSSSGMFAAAYPEGMDSSGSSSETEEEITPVRSFSLENDEIASFNFMRRINSDLEDLKTEISNVIIEVKEAEECSPAKIHLKKRKNSIHDIYNDLDHRIKASQQNITDLCNAEQSLYSHSGSTSFSNLDIARKSNSLQLIPDFGSSIEKPEEPNSALLYSKPVARKELFRPKPIQIKPEVRPDATRDYKYHLANYPEHWEITGVEKISEFLKPESKIHFQNISSAAALNRVRQIRNKFKKVTCEIPAVHLYFTSASVNNGDTRFKNTPPVRNQGNCNLLWDLIKMKGIDSISSQHACIDSFQKLTGNFQQALNGISSLGCSLQSVWSVLNIPVSLPEQLEHYIVRLAKWLSLHPAIILGIEAKRGSIEKGKYADLIIWKPKEKYVVDNNYFYSQTSPFMNHKKSVFTRKSRLWQRSLSSWHEFLRIINN